MKTFGFVFARGGSKGVPGKNIRPLCGKPLLAYAIEAALGTGRIEKVVVSTDSPEIAEVARQHGAEVPFLRPADLASDQVAEWLSWQHAVNFLKSKGQEFDVFISVPATAPLRTSDDLTACLDLYEQGGCDAVCTCSPSGVSPYFNMVTLDENRLAQIAFKLDRPVVRRQDAPVIYALTPVAYVTSPDYIMSGDSFWRGRVKAVTIDRFNAVDIDEPFDFELAEFLMNKKMNLK